TGSDTRGAWNLNNLLATAATDNLIGPDGRVFGLNVQAGERFVIRDFDASRPGAPPIPVRVNDHFTMADGGVLQTVFDADAWDSTIFFAAGIPVSLGGVLDLAFATDVDLASQVGRTFQLFDWAGVTPIGQFITVQSEF